MKNKFIFWFGYQDGSAYWPIKASAEEEARAILKTVLTHLTDDDEEGWEMIELHHVTEIIDEPGLIVTIYATEPIDFTPSNKAT